MATTTIKSRWPIWTDGGTGSDLTGMAGPATWVYRLADGSYLTVGPDGAGSRRETPSPERPLTPDGFPIPLQWHRLAARLPPGGGDRGPGRRSQSCRRRAGSGLAVAAGDGGGQRPDGPGPADRRGRAGRVCPRRVGRQEGPGTRGGRASDLLSVVPKWERKAPAAGPAGDRASGDGCCRKKEGKGPASLGQGSHGRGAWANWPPSTHSSGRQPRSRTQIPRFLGKALQLT